MFIRRKPKIHPLPTLRNPGPKIGRNDPCPCGSRRKFKRCCMLKKEGE